MSELMPLSEIERLARSTSQGWTWEESRRFLATARQAHALREQVWTLEGDRASLCDLLNSALRDTRASLDMREEVVPEAMKPGIETMWFALNRQREENARLKVEGCEVCGHVRGHQQTGPRSPWQIRIERLEADNAVLRAVVEAVIGHAMGYAYCRICGGEWYEAGHEAPRHSKDGSCPMAALAALAARDEKRP